MKFTVVTILPELIEPALTAGVVGRARRPARSRSTTVNPRDFTSDATAPSTTRRTAAARAW